MPTVIASAAIEAASSSDVAERLVPGLAAGSRFGGIGLDTDIAVRDGKASGTAAAVLGGGLAHLLVLASGDDAVVVAADAPGVRIERPLNLDPTRRSARVVLDGLPAEVLAGGRQPLLDLARLILAAEATGIAAECTQEAADYAKARLQFGRLIGTFEAVKHHCANMLVASELATSLVWDAARAADEGGDQRSFTAAMAAALALPAADECAQLNIQVHGGIGFTWEHDAHLYLRRATALEAVLDAEAAAADVTDLVRAGTTRHRTIDLPPEAEPMRDEVRAFAERVKGLDAGARREAMIETGYVMPHWPKPWGRDAGAVEQLVIEQEFRSGGVSRPQYGITGWVILTLVQHASEDQVARWVLPALRQEVIWCQLFSEPDAGSDAAGIKTRATKVDGGWLLNGQKVWTSGAHVASLGLATVRTDPDVPKHQGITTMVIDMHAPGVEVRPLRMVTGHSDSTRSSSTTSSSPMTTWSARSTAAGRWPGPRSATSRSPSAAARAVAAASRRLGHRALRRPPRAARGRGRTHRTLRGAIGGDGRPQHAQRRTGRRRRRAGPRGQRDQARSDRDRARVGRHPACAGRTRHGLRRRRRLHGRSHGPHAPWYVDRRRHLGDQAQPDRRRILGCPGTR